MSPLSFIEASSTNTPFLSSFSGGGSNCSVFCALSILSEQFKNDQYVDVCRTVKKLKTQRPHMIETYVSPSFSLYDHSNRIETNPRLFVSGAVRVLVQLFDELCRDLWHGRPHHRLLLRPTRQRKQRLERRRRQKVTKQAGKRRPRLAQLRRAESAVSSTLSSHVHNTHSRPLLLLLLLGHLLCLLVCFPCCCFAMNLSRHWVDKHALKSINHAHIDVNSAGSTQNTQRPPLPLSKSKENPTTGILFRSR